jgi:L-aminopeptidase/D-esterase-like protein
MAQTKPRARDIGVPFDGTPGPLNAITDVRGVEVGHSTIIKGEGKLKQGQGPVRTGVTAVLPRGPKSANDSVFAGWFSLNGNGEMTGTTWIEESGFLEGPVLITNTHSVGVVRDAAIAWRVKHGPADASGYWWSLPVVAETYDGYLNDINGFHVKPEHAFEALEGAKPGAVIEGNVGGGTGMICYGFKGGIGTASRKVGAAEGYTVGVLVQANFGRRDQLRIAGVPVGIEVVEGKTGLDGGAPSTLREKPEPPRVADRAPGLLEDLGSIIVVVATDAPLAPHQLKRLARRVSLGIARTGAYSGNGSGDIFVAFSTANPDANKPEGLTNIAILGNDRMNPLFEATVQATEEAIVNALVAAETMVGADDHRVVALPHDRLREALKKYNRLAPQK